MEKRVNENDDPDINLVTMIRGTCSKDNLLDLFENFIAYEESGGKLSKILSKIINT